MKKVLLGMVVLAALASCKKDEKKCDLNSTNILGSYKVTASVYKENNSTPEVNEFANWDACQKDDVTTLNSNGSAIATDAGTVCDPNGTYTSTWALVGDRLTIDGEVATVTSFDCGGMTVKFEGPDPGEYTITTLVKQ